MNCEKHEYQQTDSQWKKCIHCGDIKPLLWLRTQVIKLKKLLSNNAN